MQTNPTKDSDLNISVRNWDRLKFRDLRQKAQEEFNLVKQAKKIEAIYEEVLKRQT